MRYPAFLDSSLALMRRPARELNEIVSESVWLRLSQGMARCLDCVARVLRAGNESGALAVDDPGCMATVLWTQALGVMHLPRVGVGVRQAAPGIPAGFRITPERERAIVTVAGMSTSGKLGPRARVVVKKAR